MQQPSNKPAVFLDRDGTLVEEMDYLIDADQLRLIPGAAAAVRRLNDAGWAVVIITNQSMVARGMASERQLSLIHDRMIAALKNEGAHLDGIYYCPHHPDIGEPPYRGLCDCRKPLPGMLHRAAIDLALDLGQSAMIGDSLRDLEAGAAAGCRTLVLVRTGHGAAEEAMTRAAKLGSPAIVCDNLVAAVDRVLSQKKPANPSVSQPTNSRSR